MTEVTDHEVPVNEESAPARARRIVQMLRGAERLERRAHQLILEAGAVRELAKRLERVNAEQQ